MNIVNLSNPVQAIAATIYGVINIVFKNIQISVNGYTATLLSLVTAGIMILAIAAAVNVLTNTRG